MTNRIEKIKSNPTWSVQESREARKDKQQQSDEEKQSSQKDQSSFEEKTDLSKLKVQEAQATEMVRLVSRTIEQFIFKSLVRQKEYSLLEVEIFLKQSKQPLLGFVSISHSEAMRLGHFKLGQTLPLQTLIKGPYLEVAVVNTAKTAAPPVLRTPQDKLKGASQAVSGREGQAALDLEEDEVTEITLIHSITNNLRPLSLARILLQSMFIILIGLAVYLMVILLK